MHQLQRSWVRSQNSSAQWGGRKSSVEYSSWHSNIAKLRQVLNINTIEKDNRASQKPDIFLKLYLTLLLKSVQKLIYLENTVCYLQPQHTSVLHLWVIFK